MDAGSEAKKPKVILTPDSRLRVFISSTLKELAEERDAVRQSVLRLHLLPVMFEAGARPHAAQDLYQAYLSQSHVFIGIYWQSYGWVGPGMEISGLEDEFNLSSQLPRLIYVKSPAPNREAGLQRMLTRLQQENRASYKHFTSSAELGELVENDLALLLSESYEAASRTVAAEFTPRPLTNLPFPRNPLLGRAQELQTLCDMLLQDGVGLVTLTGAGGAGKSRLALEAALELRSRFPDGVYLVRLTPISDPERMLPTIAETLGLHESGQSHPVEEILTSFLSERQILLVLDNFEQILAAGPKLAGLLEACPRLKALVTSRAPLRLRGEQELPVPPLPVPDLTKAADSRQLSQYASVALFIQRAQGVRRDFAVTNQNAPAVAEICSRLDGLPLAIELAAARIRLLSPQELLARLNRRFDILRGGSRDLPERQQTLRGAIDWSYNLLTEPARTLFRRLSVFAGGCSLEAIEAICNMHGDLGPSAIDQVEALVDSSLLTPSLGLEGQQRFGMLESIREYAYERLAESGEAGRVHQAHAEYFLRFAQEVEPKIRTAERRRWRSILVQDLENIRGALQWARTSPDGFEIGCRLLITLTFFWALGGYNSEGRRQYEAFAALSNQEISPAVRAGLLNVNNIIELLQGGTKSPTSSWAEGIQFARKSGDKNALALALLLGGAWALASNDVVTAAQCLEECQPMFQELGDEWCEVLTLLWQSNILSLRGEVGQAKEFFDRSFALGRHQGDPWLLVVPLVDVAQGAFSSGDFDRAQATLLEIESMLRASDDMWSLGWPLDLLAQIELVRGDVPAARTYLVEALQLGSNYGNMMVQIFSLVEAAYALTVRYGQEPADRDLGKRERMNAARLCGATEHFVDYPILLGSTLTRQVYEDIVTRVHSAIEPEIWEPGFQEGQSMPFEQALDLASQELSKITD